MPIFRDAHGRLYDIPKNRLDEFLVEEDASPARITGAEIASAPSMGYVWGDAEASREADAQSMGYVWGDAAAGREADAQSMGYIWGDAGASRDADAMGYVWGDAMGYVWGDGQTRTLPEEPANAPDASERDEDVAV